MPLRPEERRVLQAASDAGGSYSIHGLSLHDMVLAADAVLTMQRAGLVRGKIQFEGKQPHIVAVEITAEGHRVLKSEG